MTLRPATREERQLALLWLAAAASALALRPVWLAVSPLLRPCVFRSLVGFQCPTCGTTRAATAFLHGDLAASFAANPLAAAAGFAFIAGAPLALLWAVTRGPMLELPRPIPVWFRVGVVVLIAVNWLYIIVIG